MSKLNGKLRSDRGVAKTKSGSKIIEAWVRTERARIEVIRTDNGKFTVQHYRVAGDVTTSVGTTLLKGNVNDVDEEEPVAVETDGKQQKEHAE